MNKTSAILGLAFSVLLIACATEPEKTETPPPAPVAEEAPAPGSQEEADAVAAEAPDEGVQANAVESEAAEEPAKASAPKEPQTHAVAAAVLPPAWIFRGDLSTALLPGTAIYEGDRIETGADGRIQLLLDDGARFQLSGDSRLTLTQLAPNETSSLNGTLDLGKGGFAFESGSNGSLLPGDLDFKLGKLIVFASQAALMGRTGPKESVVCLLKGVAEAALQGQDPVTLDTPKSCISTAQAGGAGTAGHLKTLEQSLQPPTGIKAMKHKGTWALVLVSEASEAAAKKVAMKLWKEGYPAEVIEASVKGKTYFRVALRGFESRDAAGAFKKRAAKLGYAKSWVHGK